MRKTAFKKFEGVWSASIFLNAVFTNFTWSVLEHFVPNDPLVNRVLTVNTGQSIKQQWPKHKFENLRMRTKKQLGVFRVCISDLHFLRVNYIVAFGVTHFKR